MKLKFFFILFCSIIAFSVYSQKKISVNKASVTKSFALTMPFMVDSVNLKGDRFDKKELLQTSITLPRQTDFTEEVAADVATDYFFFPKVAAGTRFQFLSFQLATDRYSKFKIRVTSPGLYELYVNGKKEITKTTVEDSLKLARFSEKELTMIPGTSNFIVKYLSSATNIAPEGVKVAIELPKEDSLTNVNILRSGKQLAKIENIIEGTRITSVSISPDGRFVLSSYRSVDKTGKIDNYQELLDTRTNRKTFLGHKKSEWMPKSNRFYYTATMQDNLYLISVDPETFSETILSESVPSGTFYFTPDEKSLLLSDKESNDDRKGDLKLLASPEDRQPGYFDRYFIYRFDLATGLKQRLTFGKHTTSLNDISFDSRYLLFSTSEETVSQSPFSNTSMFRLDMQTMTVDTLWMNDYYAGRAKFSPDATKILITGSANAFGGIGLNIKAGETANNYDNQAYIMDVSTKQIEAITKNFNPSVGQTFWSNFDKMIYLNTVDKDCEHIYRYDPQKKTFALLDLQEDVIRSFSLSERSLMASYSGMSISNPARAYLLDLKSLKSTLISDPMQKTTQSLTLGEVKDWNFTASDGTLITGRYYLPPGFDAAKKYPMIVYYYGGTTPVARTFDYPYPMHVYAALGYVVYVIQPSGAIGFGQDFSARHVNAWGKRTADDIIEGTLDFTKEHSFVNDKKIGCIGASYGGFMTMYLQTRTDIFAAAISHAGISSISSYWGEGYWGYTYSSAASADSYPWNNKEMYIEQSPLFNADKIHTPLLLLHGTEDTNVPIGESIQLYTALKVLGREVEFIQVKGENHGISKYERRIQWNYSIYAWFSKWLKDDSSWWNALYPTK